jgi:hypothetical protein
MLSGEIEIVGQWHCEKRVPKFEMQIELLIFNPEIEKFVEIGESYIENYFYTNEDGGIRNSNEFSCGPEHAVYDAWIFGRQYDGSFHARWWSWGREARVLTSCHGGVSTPEPP